MIYNKNIPCKNTFKNIPCGCITEFPFIEETFDSITLWQILQKLGCKTNEIIHFINDLLDKKLIEYIDERFNDIMLDSMYESETETLVLYLTHESEV